MCGEEDDIFSDDENEVVEDERQHAPLNETLNPKSRNKLWEFRTIFLAIPWSVFYVEHLGPTKRGDEDDLKIIVATDIHVGYAENKPHRYLDSINTLEEVLKIAIEKNADMILLGGDLFHENNPTRDMQHRVVQLLRKYCLSDKEVAIEFLSDPSVNFNQSRFDRVNYEDSNLNIGLPVFTIHGNHDDMAGKGLTALDLLHEAGLVNLFGKFEEIDNFQVSPILLRKGATKLALFGIGSQRDDRLCRAFQNDAISFLRSQCDADEWFNLFVLHQNRPRRSNQRSTGAYLPELYIPTFFDLVVWGHEHECKKVPQYISSSDAIGDGFFVLQPGSTIATSLTHEEALTKHVFMIKVRGRKFQCKPIPLQTPRQVLCDEIVLSKAPARIKLPVSGLRTEGFDLDEILITEKITELVEKAKRERGPKQPELPLIRLKVIYTGAWEHIQPVNVRRLGARFTDVVANALDMIVTKKLSERTKKEKTGKTASVAQEIVTSSTVEQVMSAHFDQLPWQDRLTVLTHASLGSALEAYANEDSSAVRANQDFSDAIKSQVNDVRRKLKQMPIPELDVELGNFGNFEMTIRNDLMNMKRLIYGGDNDVEMGNVTSITAVDTENDVKPKEHMNNISTAMDVDDDDIEFLDDPEPKVLSRKNTGRGRPRKPK